MARQPVRKPATPQPADPSTVDAADTAINPLSQFRWFQVFTQLWRPTGGWVCVAGLVYAFVVNPLSYAVAGAKLLDPAYLFLELTFAAAMWGLKTFEKTRQVSS